MVKKKGSDLSSVSMGLSVPRPFLEIQSGLLATWKQRTHTRICPEQGSISSPLQMYRSRPFSCRVSLRAGPELLIPLPHFLPLKNQETHRVSRAILVKAKVCLSAFSADVPWPHTAHRASQLSPKSPLSASQPSTCLPAALGLRCL